ncbi:MAG: GNAT family N-acetyltransferase [Chloroflexi bacterium]|nr:GNAT family N-acetyltransferase [Chloroflexota bacterium]
MRVDHSPDPALIARLADLEVAEVQRRLDEEHRVYLAYVDDRPATYGWSARRTAHIGGLDIWLWVPPEDRYLWDFVTLRDFRGRGLYPALLAHIIATEADASLFWISHMPGNEASRRGILKAGFEPAGEICETSGGGLAFMGAPAFPSNLVERAARVLGLQLVEADGSIRVPDAQHTH